MAEEFLRIENLVKSFSGNTVVKGANLTFEKGEFVTLLGPSGCGKTTILRMIAGFEHPTSGSIHVEGQDITGLPPNRRKIGMVFQAYALFPNMNVAGNIAFGLRVAGMPRERARARVEEMLKLIGLPGYGKRFPFELSGGQQQRVALARAIAPSPRMLLLDEPLSALDAKIRVSLREEIRSIQRELGITTIFVTHDQEEALSMSDRIVVMSAGHIEQVGTPFEIYNFPKTRFVASFVGTLNILEARVADAASGRLTVDNQEIASTRITGTLSNGQTRSIALRPEAVVLNGSEAGKNSLKGTIEDVTFLGAIIRIRVRFGANAISLDTFNNPGIAPPQRGAPATVSFSRDDVLVLEAQP
ncbi:MAG TPA: ABC transporter ATP-binding protein [Bauldia sp.]|nr:ABC transporter ATP-binding protein [Bauldia sp.]